MHPTGPTLFLPKGQRRLTEGWNGHNALTCGVTSIGIDVYSLGLSNPHDSRRESMKVVAYLRVSTDRQVEHGHGLDVQRSAIKAWAKRHGHRIVATFSDEGVSGSNGWETREALPEALRALQDGRAKGLAVYRLDRLARDLVAQEMFLREVKKLGGEIFSTSPGEAGYLADDPDDPSRALIRQILGAVSEYERKIIALRLKAGRQHKAKKGGFAFGAPPLGYRSVDKELKTDPDEQAAVARMVELREEGLTIREIAARLGEEGFKTKRGKSVWHPTTVARVLDRSPLLARRAPI